MNNKKSKNNKNTGFENPAFESRKNALIQEFKNKRHLYEEFSHALYKLVEMLLVDNGYKYQLKARMKDIHKLEEKIIRKHKGGRDYQSLGEIEDLLGIRIVFYVESDIQSFIKCIGEEISGDLHFEETHKKSGYKATHIIAQFGKKRLQLAEYKSFAGLKCEIQLTSIMHHAWAELEHDLIYKDIDELEKTNPSKFIRVKKGLGKILEKYIKKAASEFELIVKEIRKP